MVFPTSGVPLHKAESLLAYSIRKLLRGINDVVVWRSYILMQRSDTEEFEGIITEVFGGSADIDLMATIERKIMVHLSFVLRQKETRLFLCYTVV